jgi:hypothetical protein
MRQDFLHLILRVVKTTKPARGWFCRWIANGLRQIAVDKFVRVFSAARFDLLR